MKAVGLKTAFFHKVGDFVKGEIGAFVNGVERNFYFDAFEVGEQFCGAFEHLFFEALGVYFEEGVSVLKVYVLGSDAVYAVQWHALAAYGARFGIVGDVAVFDVEGRAEDAVVADFDFDFSVFVADGTGRGDCPLGVGFAAFFEQAMGFADGLKGDDFARVAEVVEGFGKLARIGAYVEDLLDVHFAQQHGRAQGFAGGSGETLEAQVEACGFAYAAAQAF